MGWSTLHPTAYCDARAALVASVTAAPTAAAAAVMTAVSVATAAQRAGFVGGATAHKEEDCYDRAGASSPCQQRASVPTPAACPRPYQLGRACGSAPGTHAPELALLSPPSPPAHPSPVCRCCWCSSEPRAAPQGRSASRCRPVAGSGWSSRDGPKTQKTETCSWGKRANSSRVPPSKRVWATLGGGAMGGGGSGGGRRGGRGWRARGHERGEGRDDGRRRR